jgi:penicillin-binding protein 2
MLPYVPVAGKTGTAEFCDNIAAALDRCIPGQWPAHAWFMGYAPYGNPEISVIAFVYNGNEGATVALPIVAQVMDDYFRLKTERALAEQQAQPQTSGDPLLPTPTAEP